VHVGKAGQSAFHMVRDQQTADRKLDCVDERTSRLAGRGVSVAPTRLGESASVYAVTSRQIVFRR